MIRGYQHGLLVQLGSRSKRIGTIRGSTRMELIKAAAMLAAGIIALGWLTASIAEAKPLKCKGEFMYLDKTTQKCMDARLKK